MPTTARNHQLQGNIVFHLINRAASKSTIFHNEDDFERFKILLKRYIKKFEISIFHWVIMSNHYHLLIEIQDPSRLPALMAGINKSYTNYHHKSHLTYGFLWQGRYKSQPVQKDLYLLACGRYIERNPVAAGMVSFAEDYPHSSARYYTNGINDEITSPSLFYQSLGQTAQERQLAYRQFLMDFDQNEEAYFERTESPIGNEIFRNKLVKEGNSYLPRRKGRVRNTRI